MNRPSSHSPQFSLAWAVTAIGIAVVFLSGCAGPPLQSANTRAGSVLLRNELAGLAPNVNPIEAERLAQTAVEASASLAREYRPFRPPWLNNFMVNWGVRQRGLCYEWTNDLYPHLHALDSKSLQIHLAVARMDTRKEHNCIVVTARGQDFAEGLALDPWRGSGKVWFGRVATDKYPWKPLPRDRVAPALEKLFPPPPSDP